MDKGTTVVILSLGCLGILAIGSMAALFLGAGLLMGAQRREAASYVETDGTVVSSEVRSHQGGGQRGDVTMYEPDIFYHYEVNRQEYSGDRYTYGGAVSTGSRAWADNIVRKYPVGSKCKVYHDAKDPSKSLLVKDPGGVFSWFPTVFTGIGIALLIPVVAGLVLLVVLAGTLLARGRESTVRQASFEAPVRPADCTPAPSVEPPPPEDLEAEDEGNADEGNG